MQYKSERMLEGYYHRDNDIKLLEHKIDRIQKRIEGLRMDLKECNVELHDTLKSIDYTKDMVDGGMVGSNIERELDKAVDRTLKDLEKAIREKYQLKARILNLKKKADDIEVILDTLTEEDRKILKLRYGGRKGKPKTYRAMEVDLNLEASYIFTKHKKLLKYLEERYY